MTCLCRPKPVLTAHALLQGLLLLSFCLAPSQAHPGGVRPCPLREVSHAEVTRAPGSSGPHAPENEPRSSLSRDDPQRNPWTCRRPMLHVCRVALSSRLSLVLLLPHSCCRKCNRRFVCRRCGLCSGKHLRDAVLAANASTAVAGCGCRQNISEPLALLVQLERSCCADPRCVTLRMQESFVAYCTLQADEKTASFWSNETGFVLSLSPLLPNREL